jgi:Flp pilus assembly protein TadD
LDEEAKAHFARREYDKAVMIWEKALAIRPNSPDVYQKIGAAHLRLGDYSMAEEAFRQVIDLRPDAWGVLLELAKLQLLSGDIVAAEVSFAVGGTIILKCGFSTET